MSRSDLATTRVFHRFGSTVLQETGGTGGALTHTPGFAQRGPGATGDRLTYEEWPLRAGFASRLGSTRYTTDNAGVQKGGYAFDAFGRNVATAPGSDGQPQDFMWGGGWGYQSEDAASGLVLIGQRHYGRSAQARGALLTSPRG